MGQMSVILVSSVVRNISDLLNKDQDYTWIKILSLYVGLIDRCSYLSSYLLALPSFEARRRRKPYRGVGSPKD